MADKKNPSGTTTICLGSLKETIDTIPKFLRSQYIVECIQKRIAAEGPPKYTAEDKDAATKRQAAARALGSLKKLDDAALAAAGFVRATPPAPPHTPPAPAPGKGPTRPRS